MTVISLLPNLRQYTPSHVVVHLPKDRFESWSLRANHSPITSCRCWRSGRLQRSTPTARAHHALLCCLTGRLKFRIPLASLRFSDVATFQIAGRSKPVALLATAMRGSPSRGENGSG